MIIRFPLHLCIDYFAMSYLISWVCVEKKYFMNILSSPLDFCIANLNNWTKKVPMNDVNVIFFCYRLTPQAQEFEALLRRWDLFNV